MNPSNEMDIKLELTTHHPADDWESNVRGGVTPQTKRVLCLGKYNHLPVSREKFIINPTTHHPAA
ncbi:MAG: hypothetical protein UFA98_05525 [Ruminococcus sp.]|nr:hypothetical protein [Ruminococcus sp.]